MDRFIYYFLNLPKIISGMVDWDVVSFLFAGVSWVILIAIGMMIITAFIDAVRK